MESANLRYSDPLVLGIGAFAVGFVVGSGRWDWFGKELGRLAQSLGTLALEYVSNSIHEHNPDLFKGDQTTRVTH
jgi:hypothetical protein